jgi:Hint domain
MDREITSNRPSRRHFARVAAAIAGSLFLGTGRPAKASGCLDMYTGQYVCCFLSGTRILAEGGEIAVERIGVGDRLKTIRGDLIPVKWVGRRTFANAGAKENFAIRPIRITRSALDEGIPHADLYVSPAHCLYIDGVLIPADHLINGLSIFPAMPEGVRDIEYYHLELESHEVIFAEGALAETLLVTSDREHFDNFVEYERLYGADSPRPMSPYAPIRCYNGGWSELEGLLRRLASPAVDIRDPIQTVYDRILERV